MNITYTINDAIKKLLLAIGSLPSKEIDWNNPKTTEEYLALELLEESLRETLQSDDVAFNKIESEEVPYREVSTLYSIRSPNAKLVLIGSHIIRKDTNETLKPGENDKDIRKVFYIKHFPFDCCPLHVQNFIIARASRKLSQRIFPEQQRSFKQLATEEEQNRVRMVEGEDYLETYNILGHRHGIY